MNSTTPIEKCSLGKNATYDAGIATSKGWTNLAIYPNGNLVGTSPSGIDDEFVPRYAEMLAECAPDLLRVLGDLRSYVAGAVDWEQPDCPAKADLLRIDEVIARATGSEAGAHDEPRKLKDAFAVSLAERIAELEARREKASPAEQYAINGQIGLIQAIAHDYSEAVK
jgi:hypothetical protein